MAADYFIRQATDADGLAAELDTPEKRRRYVAQFYGSRFWAAPGSFAREDVDFMTEPFADADRFRASIANYEYAGGPRQAPEPPRLLEPNPTPTLILYGPEDHVIPRDFPERMEAAFPEPGGPVRGAGRRALPAVGARRRAERRAALALRSRAATSRVAAAFQAGRHAHPRRERRALRADAARDLGRQRLRAGEPETHAVADARDRHAPRPPARF